MGACLFSIWTGKVKVREDIRDYADGNPGALNVFKSVESGGA